MNPIPLTDEQIRTVFLAHGFTVKEGEIDLKPYVFAAARALLALAAPAGGDAHIRDVLELVRDLSSQEWQQADGKRMAATDNQGRRFWFISEDVMQEVCAALSPAPTMVEKRAKRDTRRPCAVCGWSEHMAIHRPIVREAANIAHAQAEHYLQTGEALAGFTPSAKPVRMLTDNEMDAAQDDADLSCEYCDVRVHEYAVNIINAFCSVNGLAAPGADGGGE